MPTKPTDQLAIRVSDFIMKFVPVPLILEATRELGEICGEAMREGVRMKAQAELEAKRE